PTPQNHPAHDTPPAPHTKPAPPTGPPAPANPGPPPPPPAPGGGPNPPPPPPTNPRRTSGATACKARCAGGCRRGPAASGSAQGCATATKGVPGWQDHGGRERSARLQVDQLARNASF